MNKIKQKHNENAGEIKKIKLDDLDLQIVEELKENCKQTWRALAKKLGVSPVTVMNRVKALENNGIVMGYSARVDYAKMGYEFAGWVGISIPGQHYDAAMSELLKMPETDSVFATTGDLDIVAFYRARDRSDFFRTV